LPESESDGRGPREKNRQFLAKSAGPCYRFSEIKISKFARLDGDARPGASALSKGNDFEICDVTAKEGASGCRTIHQPHASSRSRSERVEGPAPSLPRGGPEGAPAVRVGAFFGT